MTKFYDTNAIIELGEKVLDFGKFYISSVSLEELENIKTNRNKDEAVKAKSRKCLHMLDENSDCYKVIIYNNTKKDIIDTLGLEETPDNKICACASTIPDVEFVTNDLACKVIAKNIFGLNVSSIVENEDSYTGFIEETFSDDEMAYLYEHPTENNFNLLNNQYLIVKNTNNEMVDVLVWKNGTFEPCKTQNIKSNYYGTVKPYNGDIYQRMAINSFSTNQLTMIKGVAGTGKSYLALGYLLYLLEKHKIDRIVVFCNPVATANSAKLGYYPGTKDEKICESNTGNMLASKLGGSYALEQMIQQEKIVLLPMSDIRGYDTSGMNAGVYITEAQNMDISLMKLALQRIGEDSICIIDGDYNAQVDLNSYAGSNNGMRRMSEVFRGQTFYGEVELQNIYRSRIAEIAQMM